MLEQLLHYERNAFFLLNGSDSIYLDHFMWLFSTKSVWLPLAVFILIVLCYKKNWKEVLFILISIALVTTLCDQFASHFCKPFFARFRPTSHPDFMNEVQTVFGYRSGRYGFISSHAANAFGFAIYLSMVFRNRFFAFTVFFWSAFTAYTRVYLGVHFISDVVFGAIAGLIYGFAVFHLYKFARKKILGGDPIPPSEIYTSKSVNMISYAIWISIALILILNYPLVEFIRLYF